MESHPGVLIMLAFVSQVIAEDSDWSFANYEEHPIYDPNELVRRYPGYGDAWVFFPDGDGRPQVMLLDETVPAERFNKPEDFVSFWLFTRFNPERNYTLEMSLDSIQSSPYDPSKPTKFITHGWRSSGGTDSCTSIKNAFLLKYDCNVVILDWAPMASSFFYVIPMLNIWPVAGLLADMVLLMERAGANVRQMHVVGHSLGAHLAGIAGKRLNGRLQRITGLDPAAPGFHFTTGASQRLNATDASFVDVIHTCAGMFGYFGNIGHVDFYPNGGTPSQPGCWGPQEIIESCSHGRSWQYFLESLITSKHFMAQKCSSWHEFIGDKCLNETVIPMGEPTPLTARGAFYLRTRANHPFALGTIFGS